MAPRKNAAKKNAAKQRRPKNHGGKAPTAIREETKEESAGATGKADTVVSDEEISDKPAGNNLAASKEDSKQGSTEPLSETSTAPTTTKTSEKGPETLSGETRATTKEPTPEPVGILSEDDVSLPPGILSEDDVPLASLKRKRSIEDKWTANTDAPAPKSPKLVEGQADAPTPKAAAPTTCPGPKSTASMTNVASKSSPSPFGKTRELRLLEELASEEWDTEDLCENFCCVDTADLSRIPSPFADLADRADRVRHIIGHHVHPQVKFLFDNLQRGDVAKLTTRLDERQPGAFGAFQCDGLGPQFFAVPQNPPKYLLELNKGFQSKGDTDLDFRVRKNAGTGEIGYFVVNGRRSLFINEKQIAMNSVVGPLPNFAFIQVGHWVVFLWCTRAALGYIPESVSQGVKAFEDENAIKKPSDPYSGPRKGFSAALQSIIPLESDKGEVTEPTRQPISWEKILEDRLRRHTKQRIAAGSMHHHDIVSPSDMTIDDVLFAVATFWEPLRSRGRDFAIAGADVIGAAGQLKSSRVVGTGNVFIMPLIFPADPEHVERGRKRTRENNANELNRKGEAKKDKVETEAKDSTSPPGHVLLAIATEDQAPPYNVNIKIYDSRSNTVDSDVIRRKATKVARIWLQRYVQAEISFRRVPQQTGHSNTSGLYVILNAWAAMLNIGPIRDASSRRGGCGPDAEVMEDAKSIGDAQFVEDALQIVNLGLAGSLDSEMFRAFLNYSGYIDGDVAPREGEDDNEDVVIAARMDLERFDRALEQAVNPPSNQASPPTSAHSNDSFEREMEDSNSASSSHSIDASGRRDSLHKLRIKRFLSQASVATLEQAEDYLNATGWDVDEAVYEFGVQQSQISAEIEGVKPLG